MQFTAYHSSSAGNLYSIESGNKLLIEAGVPIRQIREALKFGLSDIAGCLITHAHQDHAKAVHDLQRAGVDCYMTSETASALACNCHRTQIIEPLRQFKLANFTVMPFETQHDCPGAVGYLISDGKSKLLFATDTCYIKYRFSGISIFAIECNFSLQTIRKDLNPSAKRRLLRSHFSLEHVLEFLHANDLTNCREIHLLHLSDGNSDAELFRRRVQQASGKPVYVGEK